MSLPAPLRGERRSVPGSDTGVRDLAAPAAHSFGEHENKNTAYLLLDEYNQKIPAVAELFRRVDITCNELQICVNKRCDTSLMLFLFPSTSYASPRTTFISSLS
ncbi:hypothetical protein NXS19_012166 [Fusarium pseudograminearum]|nr:hypothetical protein NXS19_012166 [Fusarium pseudograminearum]